MIRSAVTAVAFALIAFLGSTLAQGVKGSRQSKCPAEAPCGGLYGDCGVGAFCLGGCDPTISNSFDVCVPNPVCKAGTYKLDSLDDVQSNDKYLGDSSKVNWVSQGDPVKHNNGILLTMAEGTVGTLLSSTFYVWYGKICAKMTSSQGAGVVTAFIMMSDVKDEIDFEWVGADITNVQTNWYSQGVTDYTNGRNISVNPDSVSKVHEYCLDWTPEKLTWSVDGVDARSINKADTHNKTADKFDYPQTPSRIMLSLWPAGLPSNGKGTIEWAGGVINWNSNAMRNGYYYAMVEQVTVDCYDAPSGTKMNGKKSYKYTDDRVAQESVELSNDLIVLGSLDGTGKNPGEPSKSSSGAAPTKTVANVPGGVQGGGARQETTAVADAAAAATGTPGSVVGSGESGFTQGTSSSTGTIHEPSLAKLGGSAVAIVIALAGLFVF